MPYLAKATYYASAVDKAMQDCFLLLQVIALLNPWATNLAL